VCIVGSSGAILYRVAVCQVPLEKQVDAVKKHRQMVLLEECLYNIKMGFNKRFLALRALKKGALLEPG
jgi:hypothetical protein